MPAVTSETEVANLALQALGERRILDINDTGERAAVEIKAVFKVVRQGLLRSHRFSFSEGAVALQRLADPPLLRYDYAYQLPDDCLKALAINDDDPECQGDFEIFSDSQLHTDWATVDLRYIKDVPTVAKWDALFAQAMGFALAVQVCQTITGSSSKVAELEQKLQGLALPEVKAADARESRPERPWHERDSRLVKSRRSSILG